MKAFLAGWIVATALLSRSVSAHEGPPYLVFLDKPVGPYEASLWADPDVGVGTFFVSIAESGAVEPSPVSVHLDAWPKSGRLPLASSAAVSRGSDSYVGSVAFDRAETWTVRVRVTGARGAGLAEVDVAVTPPGYGRWDLLIYVAPFVGVALVWARTALRRAGARS